MRTCTQEDFGTSEKAKELFLSAKEEISEADTFRSAVLFWILNKCSYSGLTENSSFSASASNQNFSTRGAKKLKEVSEIIQHWEITNHDYSELLMHEGDGTFCFLDPPYMISSYLYGAKAEMHKEFKHDRFIELCHESPNNWLVTYNVNEELKKSYSKFNQEEFRITSSNFESSVVLYVVSVDVTSVSKVSFVLVVRLESNLKFTVRKISV